MVLWFLRAVFVLMIASILLIGGPFDLKNTTSMVVGVLGCMCVLAIGLMTDFFVKRKSVSALAGIFFGLVVGLLIGLAFNYVLEFVYAAYNISKDTDLFLAKDGIKLIINVLCCYLAIIFIMQSKDDFRFIIPYVEFSKQTKGVYPLILDTSVIIDGRIADIATTRIVDSPMIIPRFVLNELQNIADSPDRLRRNRGRRGLDMLNKMQSSEKIDLSIEDIDLTPREQSEPVDHKLVATAKKMGGKVVTNDYNLNKVAILRGVEVINLNDLANALKPVVLPGEAMRVKLVKPGDQIGQGVGYMDDGTMVVVEQGRQLIGREIDVTVTSVLQTSAGRMIFGKGENDNRPNSANRPSNYRGR